MRTLDTLQFRDADRYSSYLKTPLGRLRSDLAWENLQRFLPVEVRQRRALDFSDYRDHTDLTSEAAYREALELELILRAEPAFASIACYRQVIAGQSGVSRRNEAKP
jgi:hypothetical protein